ncbi:MAG: hypothetical protein QW835_06950 [Candidatus Hadarchaeum sp.]|uniref:hypothetical protein n=1 Tax=Candidatus Hadarchaeum sp. TaxID=2883567 RepID=UPI00317A7D9B
MHVTVGYLLAKAADFKVCLSCFTFNWYENDTCVCCGEAKFRKATKKDVGAYVRARKGDEHFCEECEIEV